MKSLIVLALVVGCCVPGYSALANDQLSPSFNRVKLSMGSYIISWADTTFALTERDLGVGLSIDPHESLGTDLEQSVFRLDGAYRFNTQHSIHFSWFKINNSGTKVVETDFDWVDQDGNEYLIEAGSELFSNLSYNITRLSYRWNFYNSNKVELFTNAGLHYSSFAVDVEVNSTVSGASSQTNASARNVDSDIPLPVVGLGVRYNITEQWSWYLRTEFFALEFDDWRGIYSDAMFGVEYAPFNHFGVAVGLGSNTLDVVEDADDYRFSYNNRITGITVQLTTMF